MSSSRIVYTARPDANPETEVAALAAVYRFLLDRYANKEGGSATARDARKESNGSGKSIVPRQG
jgi:hypothetical protein